MSKFKVVGYIVGVIVVVVLAVYIPTVDFHIGFEELSTFLVILAIPPVCWIGLRALIWFVEGIIIGEEMGRKRN